ncbi:uncharacterized protein LOC116342942 [Contarinia nasturtii]|uniref:uncharacterized protein LOC116342942 n=1 Tax=Contarinia nasturtii TaxID=265458 RepID=UPI0012D3E4ED|nr:uncharacterized protein LOC116342942 [Contarinia nasturtii]
MLWLKYEAISGNHTNIDNLVQMGIDNGCQAFIVTPNSVIDFMDGFENVRFTSKNRYHSMHVVALPTTIDKTNQYINDILNCGTVQDIPNILIISHSTGQYNVNNNKIKFGDSSYDLITSQFVGQYNTSEPRLLDTFDIASGTLIENANLFPDKFSNLQGRLLRIALFNYKPYTIWMEVTPGTGNMDALDSEQEKTIFIDGTESRLIMAFCKLYNCTLAVLIDEESEWGVLSDNMTGNGVLGAIVERRADVGIAGLFLWFHEFLFLDYSSIISRSGVTCICPKPKLLGRWLLPLRPFTPTMWAADFISFVSLFLTIFLIKLTKSYANSMCENDIISVWLHVWAIYLEQSTNFSTRHLPVIIISIISLLTSLLLANTYGAGLSSIMTIPLYEAPIDTPQQLAEKNWAWGATRDVWIYSISNATEPELKKLVSMFQASTFEKLSARRTSGDFCYSVERLQFGHYAVGDYIDEKALNYLQLMNTDIYYENIVRFACFACDRKRNPKILGIADSGQSNKPEDTFGHFHIKTTR